MLVSNLAFISDPIEIPAWDYIVSEMTEVFRLTEAETQKLYNSTVAKLVAAIPFEAHCINPERTAIAHLGIYMMEIKGFQKYCAHVPSDDQDIFERLERISHFQGGDKAVIEHGMALLAVIMLEGYKKSKVLDLQNNIYNPLNSHEWNYSLIKSRLRRMISKTSNQVLDALFYVTPGIADWW